MKKLLYLAISVLCMQNPLSALTAADVRKGEIAILGEIILAIRNGDASAVSYYVDADLVAPADYKMLIDEAEMIMAQKSNLGRWPWSWIKMIAGGATAILFMHEPIRNFHKYMNPSQEDALNKTKLDTAAKAAHDAFKAAEDEAAKARVVYDEYEQKYNQNNNYRYAWREEERVKFDPKITWNEMYKLQELRDEKARAVPYKEKNYKEHDKLLKDAGRLRDKLTAMRWTTSDLIGYGVAAAVCMYIAYTGWQAPYRAYNNAKGIASILRYAQKRAYEQTQSQVVGFEALGATLSEQKK